LPVKSGGVVAAGAGADALVLERGRQC
jgi:hypothetical protein